MANPGPAELRPYSPPKRGLVALLAILLPAALAPGCGARQTPRPVVIGPEGPTQQIEMEPMQILAERGKDGKLVLRHRDAASLFRSAGAAFDSQDHARAVEEYSLLLQEFPGSSYTMATRYNLGLALEELHRHAEALVLYREILVSNPSPGDALDARFRIASCQNELADYEGAAQTLQEVLGLPTLGREDRLLAQLRLGDVLLAAGHLDEAEKAFHAVLGRTRLKGSPAPLPAPPEMVSQAQYGLARLEHQRFTRAPIRMPQAQMERDINEKARLFLRAQAGYLRTIHLRIAEMVTAAGLKIGTLYEDFYRDLMQAPVPPELNSEEVEVYFEELRKVIRPLVEQAIHVYERNLLYAERFGQKGEWIAETEARLERLRQFITGKAMAEPGFTVFPETDPSSPLFIGPPAPPESPEPATAPAP